MECPLNYCMIHANREYIRRSLEKYARLSGIPDSKDFVFGARPAQGQIFIDKIPVSISDVLSGRLRPEGE